MPDPQLTDFGTTAYHRSDFGSFYFLIPNFLNLPALPTQSQKRILTALQRNMASSSNDQTRFDPLTIPMRWAQDLICGRYTDFAGIHHGFIARVRGMSN